MSFAAGTIRQGLTEDCGTGKYVIPANASVNYKPTSGRRPVYWGYDVCKTLTASQCHHKKRDT
ncbi:hypothetical protein CEP54_013626 [Fusarium duplospermum]|uniref:Uncharacterized protein n=1 Tax=Fusarium duplospermum TaxID=1325734 RepID=A0A428P1R0_9HYPO|nr:hypothetical protein CEP54_013626 [Fusarium duplospermum]